MGSTTKDTMRPKLGHNGEEVVTGGYFWVFGAIFGPLAAGLVAGNALHLPGSYVGAASASPDRCSNGPGRARQPSGLLHGI